MGPDHIELYGWSGEALAQPIVFAPHAYGAYGTPFLTATRAELQRLVDTLWECGVRPMAANGSAGQLDAVHKHLADVRAIAFAKLKVTLP